MSKIFDVNTDSAIQLSAKLERLHKSAFPSAVRNTLNATAFDAKKNIPKVSKKIFITRQASFFRRFSTVKKAEGFNMNKMKSTVGINASLDKKVADNLVSQEFGGKVNSKKLIPHNNARVGRSLNKRVSAANRFNKVKIHDASRAFKNAKGSRGSRFIAAVMSTAKSGKPHMMIKSGDKGMVYELKSVSQSRKTRKVNFKIKKLYSVRSNNSHNVKSTKFMKRSVDIASRKMNGFYKNNAEFQFKKFLK